jgi:lipopolysaccharide/colanic/teichoic acid biosynthesis glycosyltransferase
MAKRGLTQPPHPRQRPPLTSDQWMRLDLDYIDKWSLHLDFLILLRTAGAGR